MFLHLSDRLFWSAVRTFLLGNVVPGSVAKVVVGPKVSLEVIAR